MVRKIIDVYNAYDSAGSTCLGSLLVGEPALTFFGRVETFQNFASYRNGDGPRSRYGEDSFSTVTYSYLSRESSSSSAHTGPLSGKCRKCGQVTESRLNREKKAPEKAETVGTNKTRACVKS